MSTDQTSVTNTLRRLGGKGPEVSAIGVGTWALGGPYTFDGRDAGWGPADDQVSIRALHTAIDHGVTLIDTAASYGAGHSERVVGQALAQLSSDARDRIVVATKFGFVFDEQTRTAGGSDVSPAAIRAECEASLRRLGVEAIGLYQLHGGADGARGAEDVVAVLEDLVREGKIRWFGTSQDAPEIISVFARSPHAVSVQTQVNVFGWSQSVLDLAREHNLSVLARSPLAMGLLSGRYTLDRKPAPGDVRLDTPWWSYFDDDAMAAWLTRLEAVRELLTTGGRTLVQGALSYLWALNPAIIPLPGVRTPAQAEENVGALRFGPLPPAVAAEVTTLLADSPERRP
jgi:Predicted oxidoreductases (related to aryl-alcohol dehydrogenases)